MKVALYISSAGIAEWLSLPQSRTKLECLKKGFRMAAIIDRYQPEKIQRLKELYRLLSN